MGADPLPRCTCTLSLVQRVWNQPRAAFQGFLGYVGLTEQYTAVHSPTVLLARTEPQPGCPAAPRATSHGATSLRSSTQPSQLYLHDLLVPARSPEGNEGEAAGGSVVEGDADAPEIDGDAVRLLLRLPQDRSLVHVRVLQG